MRAFEENEILRGVITLLRVLLYFELYGQGEIKKSLP